MGWVLGPPGCATGGTAGGFIGGATGALFGIGVSIGNRLQAALPQSRNGAEAGRKHTDLGPVAHAHARFTHPGFLDGVFGDAASWMLTEEHGGTGGFADLGIHLVDLLSWLAPGKELRVRGAELTRRPACAVDVGGLALLTWGATPVSLHAGWTSRPGGFLLRVEGEHGSVEVGAGGTELTATTKGSESNRRERHPPIRAGAALVAFLGDLRGQSRWEAPTPADIEGAARILDAVKLAAGRSA